MIWVVFLRENSFQPFVCLLFVKEKKEHIAEKGVFRSFFHSMCFCSLRSFPLYQSFVSTRRAIGFADNAVLSLLRRSFDESFHFCAFVTTGEQYTGVGYSLNSVTVRYNRRTMAADKRSWVTEAIARIKRDIVIVEEKTRRRLGCYYYAR